MGARIHKTQRRKGARITMITAAIAAIGVVVTLAVTAQGYEAEQVPRLETSVWVTRDAGQYARVNTQLAEIDTVRSVDDPSSVVQSGRDSTIFAQGFRQRWSISADNPLDLVTDSDAKDSAASDKGAPGENTPSGTRDVVSAGHYVAYRTNTGSVLLANLTNPSVGPTPVDPLAGDNAGGDKDASYVATAIAVSDAGLLAMYSAKDREVRTYDAVKGEFVGKAQAVASAPPLDAEVELAVVGQSWVLFDAATGRAWVDGLKKPVATRAKEDARLQPSTANATRAFIADSSGLLSLELASGRVSKRVDATGVPAAPIVVAGVTYAAWLSSDQGTMWDSKSDSKKPLEVESGVLKSAKGIAPVFRSNGDRAVLNETTSGMLWTVPDGTLIPVEQWSLNDETNQEANTVQVDDVTEQKPPVAEPDTFGVRAGSVVRLPVLLNDHDPNKKDVLTIVPKSIKKGLSDSGFGSLSLTSNDQELAVRVAATSGKATFSYAVTDGVSQSAPAKVTLNVIDDDQNSAPVWCGVDKCKQEWPSPQVLAGGTVIIPILSGWVDPEGDPFVLSDAHKVTASDPVTVVPMADGRVAVRHTDANAADAVIQISITVTDDKGAQAEKKMRVLVSSSPPIVAAPIALVAGAGESATVRVADHVTGGSGSFRVVDAVAAASTSSSSGLVVVPNSATGTIDVEAKTAGEYAVTYTVQDTITHAEQSALLRLTVVDSSMPLAMPPLTAFVRQNEDTTVDVIDAVQNTTGRVLIVSSTKTTDPNLSVSLVGQSRVRVSGSTDDGKPGRVGTVAVTVTDGAGANTTGQLTVFLTPSSSSVSPIAVPDAVTMRAGGRLDIPVTENDVSPRGERLNVHPTVESKDFKGGLAFASGNTVRVLAPKKAGVYTLRYSLSLENEPNRVDSASITLAVLPLGANRAPQPTLLTARVLSGQSVSIPFNGFRMDPDGDQVVLADVGQPRNGSGTATISAEGNAILYTAPVSGVKNGQVSFTYTVRDPSGTNGKGIVKVGVLDSDVGDVTPVTYSDYVRVQKGASLPITVEPLLNDSDPAQGELSLVSVVPNAPDSERNVEYARLSSLIDPSTSLKNGRVVLRAGNTVGPSSYVYTVRSSASSSTSQGLIVVNVTDASSAEFPVVTDTVLTAENRGKLEDGGIDVVSGHVQWATGDLSTLKISVWGSVAKDYTVKGHRIKGEFPKNGGLVPFSLTGKDATGESVVSYGFLRIPAFNDMRLQLKPNVKPISVKEGDSVTFSVRKVLDYSSSDDLVVRADRSFTVQRANAKCASNGGFSATYSAGSESPWTDSCLVAVRLQGQSQWSQLPVPIAIIPQDPQPVLQSVSRTVAPGDSDSLDMYSVMTSWEGGRAGDKSKLSYSVSPSSSLFTISKKGTVLTFSPPADATPGSRESVDVSIASVDGARASITLVVGVAPKDAPRGASFTQQCDVSRGANCIVDVVGRSGEYDPFKGKAGSGLKLVSVGSGSSVNCPVAMVTAQNKKSVRATWPSGSNPAGGTCQVPFTVSDAQGRTGSGELTLDVLGYPLPPSSVTTTGYTGSSVTLSVTLGEAATSHPALTSVGIFSNGRRVSADCSPSLPGTYSCTVAGLSNGDHSSYTARAINSVGQSRDTSAVTAWSYQSPKISDLQARPIYQSGVTSQNTAVVELSITSDSDAKEFRIDGTDKRISRSGRVTVAQITTSPGSQNISVVPISQFQPPSGDANSSGSASSVSVTAAGSPYFNGDINASASTNSVTASGASLNMNGSAETNSVLYVVWKTSEPVCTMGADRTVKVSSGQTSANGSFQNLDPYNIYHVKACGLNGYGVAQTSTKTVYTVGSTTAPTGDSTYTIALNAANAGDAFSYKVTHKPNLSPPDSRYDMKYNLYGSWTDSFQLSADQVPVNPRAKACRDTIIGQYCTAETALSGNVPTFVNGSFPATPSTGCFDETITKNMVQVSSAANGSYDVSVTGLGSESKVTVNWTGAFSALKPVSRTVTMCAAPPPEPPVDGGTDTEP